MDRLQSQKKSSISYQRASVFVSEELQKELGTPLLYETSSFDVVLVQVGV